MLILSVRQHWLVRRGGGGWVSERMFSREQYEQLRSFPEISRDELFRYFTLTPADVAFVDPTADPASHGGPAPRRPGQSPTTGPPPTSASATPAAAR